MNMNQVFTVSEINCTIKDILENIPTFQNIFIKGEISNFKQYPSGHRYFTLKDADSSLKCVLFKGNSLHISTAINDGMQVILGGRISVYPRDGIYQFIVNSVDMDGVGDLHIAFEKLKQKLSREGLFDESHKKSLPLYPEIICIVTSPAGAAIHDMIRILNKRFPLSHIRLIPVRVQGEEAPSEICQAIQYVNDLQLGDVIIVGRGGGSIEDLWAFNDEKVARTIYNSKIPIISAVGHEPDVTISDYVADRRASTPSNAAEIITPDSQYIYKFLNTKLYDMEHSLLAKIRSERQKLTYYSESNALRDPLYSIHEKQLHLDKITNMFSNLLKNYFESNSNMISQLAASLDALSPLKVLSRGYSIVQDMDENIIKKIEDVSIDDSILIRLNNGKLKCIVEEKF